MTDRDDDEVASGVPRSEVRGDSGAHVAPDSGRHTNRNVVSRVSTLDRVGPGARDLAPAIQPDDFDVVTPVLPQPRDVFVDEDATLSHDEPELSAATPERDLSAVAAAARSEAIMARVRERLPRITPSPLVGPLPESRRASTEPGHVEPRRRPTTPPPRRRTPSGPHAPDPAAGGFNDPDLTPTSPGDDQPFDADLTPSGARDDRAFSPDLSPGGARDDRAFSPDLSPGGAHDDRAFSPDLSPGGARAFSPDLTPSERGRDRMPTGSRRGRVIGEPERTPTAQRRDARAPAADRSAELLDHPHDHPHDRLLDRVLRVVAVLAVLGLGAAGLAQPSSVLRGGIAWLVFLVFVLSGWGAIVARIARVRDPDVGLRAALGAAGYLAVAGVALAIGVLTRPVLLALIAAGIIGFAWRELTAPVAIWQRIRDAVVFVRARPAVGVLAIALVALAAVRMLGAVAALDRNPWDDDSAYTPLVKRLLDVGDLVEPFSYRRLGAYGGQIALEALAGARGTLANVHLVDKGVFFGVALLLVTGYARERRTRPLWLALIGLALLVLPDTAINTASYWTGAAMFLALYRAAVRGHWGLAGLAGAAACTLRQNFAAVVVIFIAAVLAARLIALARTMPLGEAWRGERRHWIAAAAVALAVLVPWWIAALRSNHTFLFPLVGGTWNHELSLNPAVVTWSQKLEFLIACSLEPAPIAVVPILAPVFAFAGDPRLGKPLLALFGATALGFAILVVSLVGTESAHVWRYVFGFATPLFAVLALEISAEDDERVALPALGRWLVLAGIVLQIVLGRSAVPKQYAALFGDVREAAAVDRHGDPSAQAEARRYRAMQAALPAGAPAVFMLDDGAFLDFRRNPLANLDVPGFASPAPQLPAFRGAEPLREYLVAAGYRHAAFVRPDRSRYHYRREFWLQRTLWDSELFQVMGAYMIDMIDGLTELATTTRVLYDSDGLVVLDLGAPLRTASRRAAPGDEPTRRNAWMRELADREGVHDAWSLATRADVRFEDGIGGMVVVDDADADPRWFEVSRTRTVALKRGTPIRPLYRRVHLRVRGTTDMRLQARIAIGLNSVYTHPRVDVSIDGELLASVRPDDRGRYQIDAVVPRDRLTGGWHDLYFVFSTISEPDKVVRDLRIARLEALEWSPR